MRKTTKCPYNIPFHRRHCLLAEFMKMLNENDFLYAIDSDVISHNYEGDWEWNNEDLYDFIFFERFWNGEVVAGKDKSPEVPFHGITLPYSYFEVI
jgi:hypothetical protein